MKADIVVDLTRFASRSQELISAGKFLYAQGWSPATSSNYSARLDDSHLAITVSGKHKGQLTAADIMLVDMLGQPVQCDRKPSAETLLHTVIYQELPEVNAVLHTHSVSATVVSKLLANASQLEWQGYELQKAFRDIGSHEESVVVPIFENTQDIPALAEQTRYLFRTHDNPPGYLIRGHGLYTWGIDMEESLRHIEAFEFLLRCRLLEMRTTR